MPNASRTGHPEWDGQAFALNDPRIPSGIALAANAIASVGDTLHYAHTKHGGEWWLLDAEGELIESFWQEK